MNRLALAILLSLTFCVVAAPPAEAAMTKARAERLKKKWKSNLSTRKSKYIQSAGKFMYWQQTVAMQKRTDAPRAQIQRSKKNRDSHRKAASRMWRKIRTAARKVKHFERVIKKLENGVHAGKGWGGSEGVADTAKRIAARMGIPVTSQKRNYAQTIAVGSSTSSDHYTGNTTAFAVDLGVSGSRGDTLARAICRAYRIPTSTIGTFNGNTIRVDGKRYRIQILWRVAGHYDHVHVGIRRQ